MFSIQHLSVSLDDRPILNDVSLSLDKGTTHVLMGPNGSGKSTLAATIMGNPQYTQTAGSMILNGDAIHEMSMHERALKGIFVGFQHPLEIPGVSVMRLLTEAYQARFGTQLTIPAIHERIHNALQIVKLPVSFADRWVNVGFSGGEKKRLELVQMMVLRPSLIILDEIDSGLDIQGLSLIQETLAAVRADMPDAIALLISHNAHLNEYLSYDQVHTIKQGSLVA